MKLHKEQPQGLKPIQLRAGGGTTEVVALTHNQRRIPAGTSETPRRLLIKETLPILHRCVRSVTRAPDDSQTGPPPGQSPTMEDRHSVFQCHRLTWHEVQIRPRHFVPAPIDALNAPHRISKPRDSKSYQNSAPRYPNPVDKTILQRVACMSVYVHVWQCLEGGGSIRGIRIQRNRTIPTLVQAALANYGRAWGYRVRS